MELPLGLLYIATALKKRGHLVKLFSLNRSGYLFRFTNFSKYLLLREINLYNPDMVCFTIHSNEYDFIIEISKMIKIHSHAKIVVGGPHVTFMADEIDYNVIDYACRGEGDEAIIELAECIKNNESPERIKNIYCIYNGKLLQNSLRDLITDLDSLPFPDRSLINQVHLRRHGTNVITGRGCPYTCTYCIAKPLSDFYRHLGKYVRWRTKENVIEELLWLKSHYSISRIAFSDQTFTLNKRRLLEFLELYNSKIKLPFICQTRVDCVDKEVFSALKKAGCEIVFMGIESGDKDIRLKTLRRNQTDEQIIDAFKLAKGVGINTIAFNMVGIPGETINTINKSIDFYRIVKPDNISTNIFMVQWRLMDSHRPLRERHAPPARYRIGQVL